MISAVALLCLLQAVIGAGVVAGASTGGHSDVQMAQETPTPTNNTSVQQENPDKVGEDGDTEAVRLYLVQALADRLGESAISISQEEYERGRLLLGDEYDSTLEKYVDVEGETGGSEDFEQAAETQRELGNTAQEYNETYQEYQEARAAGNNTRARELARELNRLAGDTNSSAQQLIESYTRIENTTGADLSVAEQRVLNVSEAIQERHETVVVETFARTNLSVRTEDATASFADPASVQGEIILENGTALSNETVEIRIGEQVETLRTDSDGAFTIDYRPVTVPNGTENVSVAYRPAPESVYLGSKATLNVIVEQTTASLNVSSVTDTAQFGDEVTVSGRAHVNGTPVEGARVRVSIGGTPVGTVETGPNGMYRLTGVLPASVPSGNSSIESVVVPADSAVRSEMVTAPLRVETTETTLSVNATRESDSRVRISGQLETADGTPVAGRTVELRIAESTVATVETSADGTFERLVTPRESLSGSVTMQAVYEEPSTNLGNASAQDRADLDAAGGAGSEATEPGEGEEGSNIASRVREETGLSTLEQLLGIGVVLLSVLVIGWLVRRDGETPVSEQPQAPAAASMAEESDSEDSGTSVVDETSALLSDGKSEAAIRALYAAVRGSIQAGDSTQTHWEFYTSASDQLDTEAAGTLERLTEGYERTVYSPNPLDQETARALLDDAEALLGEEESAS